MAIQYSDSGAGFRLQGLLRIAQLADDFTFSGWEDPLNISDLGLDPGAGEIIERLSTAPTSRGQRLDLDVEPGAPVITFKHNSLRIDQLSLIMRGMLNIVSQGAGSVTDEAITLYEGKTSRVAMRNITAATFGLTGSGGTPTHVEGTDYNLDYVTGFVKCLTSGAAGAAEASYDHAAVTMDDVQGGTQILTNVAMSFNGVNKANGKNVELLVDRGILRATSSVAVVGGDDYASFEGEILPLLPAGTAYSYKYRQW